MKSWAVIGVLTAVLSGAMPGVVDCRAQAPASAGEVNSNLIFKTDQPVKIDGVLDEKCWRKAIPVKGDYIWGKKGELSAETRLMVKYTWDDHYFYIGYEVFDTNLVVKAAEGQEGPADNRRQGLEIWVNPPAQQVDLVEFFIILPAGRNMFWELHHNAANQFNDILVLVDLPGWKTEKPAIAGCNIYWGTSEYLQDEGEYKLAMAVQMKPKADGKPSTVNDSTDIDTGYTGEVRLPWFGLGAPVSAQAKGDWTMADREMPILAVTQNGDLPNRYYTVCGTLPGGDFFHNNTACFPRYKLVADTGAQ